MWCIDVAADPTNVNECTQVCKESQAIVVSSSYRLTPENQLPAAYDDSFNALKWLQKQVIKYSHAHSIIIIYIVSNTTRNHFRSTSKLQNAASPFRFNLGGQLATESANPSSEIC